MPRLFDRASVVSARILPVLRLALAIALVWLLLEALVYRSGAYAWVADPESNTGAVERALLIVQRAHRSDRWNVLVFGDSRVGEGFSRQVASADDARFNFINVAVPGSTPRTWYYLLREIAGRGLDFDAVVVGAQYVPTHPAQLSDWPLDPLHALPLVGVRDLFEFPATFATDAMRERARRTILLPAVAMQEDTHRLLAHPLARAHAVLKQRPGWIAAVVDYAGRDARMPDVQFESAGHTIVDWADADPQQKVIIEVHLAERQATLDRAVLDSNLAFTRRWLQAMSALAQSYNARMLVYPLPRGPYPAVLPALDPAHAPLPPQPGLRVLPADFLGDIEAPEYFFDTLHANHAGRVVTSRLVGERVRAWLVAEPPG